LNIDRLAELAAKIGPDSEVAEFVGLAKQLHDEALKANRRATLIAKDLRLPEGTIVISQEQQVWGVIGKDGLIDPKSVQPLHPDWSAGGVFYTPSAKPVGSDGDGQSLIGPGFVNPDGSVVKNGHAGLAAATANALRNVRGGTLSIEAVVKDAQATVAKGSRS
jgi:hypothetical protein